MNITAVQAQMIRSIRGLDRTAPVEDLTAEQAVSEIKAAIAAGFDPNKAWTAANKAPQQTGPRFRNGRCTTCFAPRHDCGCDHYTGQH